MATPLALSLRLTRCERTSQSNAKQTIQSATRSHLVKSPYRSFAFEIHSTYVEDPNPNVSSIVRFAPSLESTQREAAGFVCHDDRGLHGEPSGRFGPEDKKFFKQPSTSEAAKRQQEGWGRDSPKRTNRVRRLDTPRRPDDGSSTNSRSRRTRTSSNSIGPSTG